MTLRSGERVQTPYGEGVIQMDQLPWQTHMSVRMPDGIRVIQIKDITLADEADDPLLG